MRLIDADELRVKAYTAVMLEPDENNIDYVKDKRKVVDLDDINNAPTIEERPTGEWKLDDTEQFCYCSNCKDTYYPRPLDPNWYYCPHCGAKMKGTEE